MSMKKIIFYLFTLVLKLVERGNMNFQCMEKMHLDLNVICFAFCMVITWTFKEQQAL